MYSAAGAGSQVKEGPSRGPAGVVFTRYVGMRGETRGDFIGCVKFGHCCGEADELDARHSYMIARAGRPTNERVLVNDAIARPFYCGHATAIQ